MSSSKTKQHESRHSDKADKKSSEKSDKKSGSKHSSGKSSTKKTSSKTLITIGPSNNVDFYFSVSELDPFGPQYVLQSDEDGNIIPFDHHGFYRPQRPGRVFRFSNGQVSVDDRHWMIKDEEGWHIASSRGNLSFYRTSTVFDCGPMVPYTINAGDSTLAESLFEPLLFDHLEGTTRVVAGAGQYDVVAGAAPVWFEPLFGQLYANTQTYTRSQGLTGDVSIVIGIMALSRPRPSNQNPNGTNFASLWRDYQWRGRERTGAPLGDLRGVVVHVAVASEEARHSLYSSERDGLFLRN